MYHIIRKVTINPGTIGKANDLDVSTELTCLLPRIQGENSWCAYACHHRCLQRIEYASNHGPHESRIDLTSLGCFPVNVFVYSCKSSTGNEQETLYGFFHSLGIGGK